MFLKDADLQLILAYKIQLPVPVCVVSSLQDCPPLLLCVFDCLLNLQFLVFLQLFVVTQTLRSCLQLHHSSLTIRLGAQDDLRTKPYTFLKKYVYTVFCIVNQVCIMNIQH